MTSSTGRRSRLRTPNDGRNQIQRTFLSREWLSMVATIGSIVSCYFASSVGLTFYQKEVIRDHHYPLTIVLCHLVEKLALAGICRLAYTKVTGQDRVTISGIHYLKKLSGVAAASSWDIGFSQWSLQYITIALYTMTKSTAIVFILIFAVIFKLERLHWSLALVVGMISSGLFMFVYESTKFQVGGFLLALSASVLSGVRWTTAQKIMQKSRLGLGNPIDMIYHMQPLMIVALLPLAIVIDGPKMFSAAQTFKSDSEFGEFLWVLLLIAFGGALAFVMEVFEFLVLMKTSSLTLSIIGIGKEIVTISFDIWRRRTADALLPINYLGIFVCLAGIFVHVIRKAANPDSEELARNYSRNHRRRRDRTNGPQSQSLLMSDDDNPYGFSSSDDDDAESDSDFFSAFKRNGNAGARRYKEPDDDFFLRDNRNWTSTRDSHLELAEMAAEASANGMPSAVVADSPIPAVLLSDNENANDATKSDALEVSTDQLINMIEEDIGKVDVEDP